MGRPFPIPSTFNNLPEGAFLTAHTNLGLRLSYIGGAGHDLVVTVQSNTPPVFASPAVVTFTELSNNIASLTNFVSDFDFHMAAV